MSEVTDTFCDFCNEDKIEQARGWLHDTRHKSAVFIHKWIFMKGDKIMCVECQKEEGL